MVEHSLAWKLGWRRHSRVGSATAFHCLSPSWDQLEAHSDTLAENCPFVASFEPGPVAGESRSKTARVKLLAWANMSANSAASLETATARLLWKLQLNLSKSM